MDFDADYLKGKIPGEDGEEKSKIIDEIIAEHNADKEGVARTNEALKSEKLAEIRKVEALEAKKAELENQIKNLSEQIKSSGTEETKQFYEAEMKRLSDETAVTINSLQEKLKTTSAKVLSLTGISEFESAIKEYPNLDPAEREDVRDLFLLRNKFSLKQIADKEMFLTEDNKTMKDVARAYFESESGKRKLLNQNLGGGATGNRSTSVKPTKKWSEMSLREQSELYRSDPETAKRLQAAKD
jgi:hypothetical protein